MLATGLLKTASSFCMLQCFSKTVAQQVPGQQALSVTLRWPERKMKTEIRRYKISTERVLRILVGFAVLAMVSVTAMGDLVDNFDGPALGAAWQEADINNSSALISVAPLAGTFQVTGVKQTNPRVHKWVKRKIVRDIDPIQGDFTATMNLSWDQQGRTAMFAVKFVVLSADGDVLATVGLLDGWIAAYGKSAYAIGSEKVETGVPLPDTASADLCIERKDDIFVISMKGIVRARGKGAIKDVAQVAIIFEYNDYGPYGKFPKSHFGEISIASIMIESGVAAVKTPEPWRIGEPIVTYWAGPMPMTDAAAKQIADGGWNLAWIGRGRHKWGMADHYRAQLDILHRHGLRGIFGIGSLSRDPQALHPLDNPKIKAKIDAVIEGVKDHPAMYAYTLRDEAHAKMFPAMARLMEYIKTKDPAHVVLNNLYPMTASARTLKVDAETGVPAAREYLRQYIETCDPEIISYDHYHFSVRGDGLSYFLNLSLMHEAALKANIPFVNFVQTCSWTVNMRIPTGEEVRWLTYTSLAYGAQGIGHYVYSHPGHDGGMAEYDHAKSKKDGVRASGKPTPLYYYMCKLNREFVAVAKQLQPLKSLAVHHLGILPKGATYLPENASFKLDPPVLQEAFPEESVEKLSKAELERRFAQGGATGNRLKGFVIGTFGKDKTPTHALVVNLDYRRWSGKAQKRQDEFRKPVKREIVGPGPLEVFDAETEKWTPAGCNRVRLSLPPGGGVLVRVTQ